MSKLASNLKEVGLALGAGTYPTAASSFTRGLMVSAFSCNPKIPTAPVPEVRGTFNILRVQKKVAKDFDCAMTFPLDLGDNTGGDVGAFLHAIYGVDTLTGVGPYAHKFTLLDDSQPPYLNLFTDKDVALHQYTGFRPQSLEFKLKAGEGLINTDVKGIVVDEAVVGSSQSLVFSTSPVVSPQEAVLANLDGAILWEEMSISIARDVERRRVIGASRVVRDTPSKGFMIKFTGKGLQFATETVRTRFLNSAYDTLSLTLTDTNGATLVFHFGEMFYDNFDGPDIKDKTLLDVSMGGFITSVDHYITLTNNRSTNYGA